jgi:hypothetical protein
MRTLLLLTFLALTVTTRAGAQNATERSTAVAGNDTKPQNQPNTNVAVTFDASAANLPQAEIRAAIGRELGTSVSDSAEASQKLAIGVEANELVVRFSAPDGSAERRVALPSDQAQIPELIRLIAGNLARDQRALIEAAGAKRTATPPHGAVVTTAAKPPASDKDGPSFRRHWLGLQVAQDFIYEPGTFVCDAGAVNTTYSCYLGGTSTPYEPNPNTSLRSVNRGVSVATTRVLASYDYALSPAFTLGGRLGVALRGGPPGAAPNNGVKGAPFWPFHLEARGSWWFAPLTNQRVRGFLGVGAGLAQFDAHPDYVTTCALGGFNYEDGCAPNQPGQPPPRVLDVWRKIGRGFVAARTGTEVRLWGEFGLELDVNVIATFPAFGVAFEPALGIVYGL